MLIQELYKHPRLTALEKSADLSWVTWTITGQCLLRLKQEFQTIYNTLMICTDWQPLMWKSTSQPQKSLYPSSKPGPDSEECAAQASELATLPYMDKQVHLLKPQSADFSEKPEDNTRFCKAQSSTGCLIICYVPKF